MTYVIQKKDGTYGIPPEQWSKVYEMGGCVSQPPIANFVDKELAAKFISCMNNSGPSIDSCPSDCRYYNGSTNEEHCDMCSRKGNIKDHYETQSYRRRYG